MAGGGIVYDIDAEAFWMQRLKSGNVPEPKYAPAKKYNMDDPKNIWREMFGRHRCPACNKPFFFRDSAFDCCEKASAYKIYKKYAHSGPAGARSLGDAIRAEVSNPYGSFGGYGGGPYGL